MSKPQYKLLTIIGARPHFTKAASLCAEIKKDDRLEEVIVHTGQHYDYNLSQQFFDELAIPAPKYNLEVGSGRHLWQMGQILLGLDDIIIKEQPDIMIVYGDTNSTAAGAIAAAKNNIPLVHVESGLREFDKTIPEEVNKLLTDAVADIYICPTQTGVDNLAKVGQTKNVHRVGDTGIDIIAQQMERIERNQAILSKYNLEKGHYFFMTCHRQANTDNKDNLKSILSIFEKITAPIVFPIHPRTRSAISKYGFDELLKKENIIVIEPIGFWDTQTLVRFAKMVITDSGGIIKEAYFHKTPGVIIDKQTEWMETVNEGWNFVAGPHPDIILSHIENYQIPSVHSNAIGNGSAAVQIIDAIKKYLDTNAS